MSMVKVDGVEDGGDGVGTAVGFAWASGYLSYVSGANVSMCVCTRERWGLTSGGQKAWNVAHVTGAH